MQKYKPRKEKQMNSRAFLILRSLVVVFVLLAMVTAVSADEQKNVLRVGPGQEYESIQAAVDAARQGSRILVYPATYFEAVSVAKNNLQIIAQGEDVIVWPPHPPAGFQVYADHVTIQGFTINFGGAADCTPAIDFRGSHNTFSDNYLSQFIGCPGINALSSYDPDGGTDYNIIERNTIDTADIGIEIRADAPNAINRGNIIRDNVILNAVQTPIGIANGTGFLVSGNRVFNTNFGSCINVGQVLGNRIPQGHHTIINNTLLHCAGGGIFLYADPGSVMSHNRIAENAIHNSVGDGLSLKAYILGTLTNNEVVSNTVSLSWNLNGISLIAEERADVSDNLIQDNVVFNNYQGGIYLTTGTEHNRILNNEAYGNDLGIYIAGDDNLIVGNRAHDNTIDLIDLGEDNLWKNNTYETTNW
jgi:parallel beta-helix repeat protein